MTDNLTWEGGNMNDKSIEAREQLMWFRELLETDRMNTQENKLLKIKIYDMIMKRLNGGSDHVK